MDDQAQTELLPGEPTPGLLRFIRASAHVCLIGMLAAWAALYWGYGTPYDKVWQIVLAQLGGGRAGGVGWGLEQGFSPYYLFFHSSMYDFIIMLYVYPLFVSGFQHLTHWPFIGPSLTKVHTAALDHKENIAPYGAIGLMLFVLFPFWSTGPLVGVVVGYLLGMRTWITFSAVIVGDVLAVGMWIAAYDRLKTYSPVLALTLLGVLFAAAMGGTFYARFRKKRRQREEDVIGFPVDKEESPETHDQREDTEEMIPPSESNGEEDPIAPAAND